MHDSDETLTVGGLDWMQVCNGVLTVYAHGDTVDLARCSVQGKWYLDNYFMLKEQKPRSGPWDGFKVEMY